ncbi:MAG TPA: DUF433 domain-containing protein [Fimbriimonadaceae bacterium]|nr:DUF433 domain-containing protein [Fimbriimonadaceae bacterium]
MKHTVELGAQAEKALHEWTYALGVESQQEALQAIATVIFDSSDLLSSVAASAAPLETLRGRIEEAAGKDSPGPIKSTPNVMGGDACIRNTRITVWTLIDYKRQGLSDSELLAAFPGLNASDLIAAWDYYASHSEAVDAERRRHEDAA